MNCDKFPIVSTGRMGAQSISIMVSSRTKCNAGCLFCISRLTQGVTDMEGDLQLCLDRRLDVGLRYAQQLGATHAILTGKADPTQERQDYLIGLIKKARQYLPFCDLHTNGLWLDLSAPSSKPKDLSEFAENGLTHITFSIASFDDAVNKRIMGINQNPDLLIARANRLQLLTRCSLVVNKEGVSDLEGILEYCRQAGEFGAHMVVIREVWIPDTYSKKDDKVLIWTTDNFVNIEPFEKKFREIAGSANPYGLVERDPLPWGAPVFVMGNVFSDPEHGVNITFAKCGEASSTPIMKSIVHKPNGHGYRNWDHNGDILY